jgi:hypothetical protein
MAMAEDWLVVARSDAERGLQIICSHAKSTAPEAPSQDSPNKPVISRADDGDFDPRVEPALRLVKPNSRWPADASAPLS